MSFPPSPSPLHLAHDNKRRDRPPALAIAPVINTPRSDRATAPEHSKPPTEQVEGGSAEEHTPSELVPTAPRSASATSSLDPYYFSVQSPAESPLPPLPDQTPQRRTPESSPSHEPFTPARDPAAIDRRGLHGLGELATPRWTRFERKHETDSEGHNLDDVREEREPDSKADREDDEPDSPWTIEAIDGDSEERDEHMNVRPMQKTVRTRPSVTEESGGEEIVYPRHHNVDLSHGPLSSQLESRTSPIPAGFPPSAFLSPLHKAKKRTSDEFELDHSGILVAKHKRSASTEKVKEEKVSVRKHRSLGVGLPPSSSRERPKERRRDSIGASSASRGERHARHTSASSSASSHGETHHPRRVHTTDFSHLPPSPSTSSIQQFLRHTGSNGIMTATPSYNSSKEHPASNVAHSLLRGTQEGWSGLDDQATAEALRKLDGLSGKTGARVRSSVGSLRQSSSSRPGTPAKSGCSTQWEGVLSEGMASRRSSANVRDSISLKERDQGSQRQGPGLVAFDGSFDANEPGGSALGSSDDAAAAFSLVQERSSLKKANTTGARLSDAPKRASASSTTYASTPTSSRDSASLSTGTSLTSTSGQSVRHSTGKLRSNSGGSDFSTLPSGDVVPAKDRYFVVSGETSEGGESVPPVPPLPKDLSSYRSPPPSSTAVSFPIDNTEDNTEDQDDDIVEVGDPDRTMSLGMAPPASVPKTSSTAQRQDPSQGYDSVASTSVVLKTPSKKWSFTNALGMKLSGVPASPVVREPTSKASPIGVSPRSATFGHLTGVSGSKERLGSWSPNHPDAMGSAASLASLSSRSSAHALSPSSSLPPSAAMPQTPDRLSHSRPGTASSGTNLSAPLQQIPLSPSGSTRRGSSTKRLTPSSIPFFRRSSSQSVQIGFSQAVPASTSPTIMSHGSQTLRSKPSTSPIDSSLSTPPASNSAHKKTSMLSLGSLLKGSSSRKNLHAESGSRSGKESVRNMDKEKNEREKEKQKKDDKDRSESRISVLMGRRRGKTLSSTDQKKAQPISMPPMQMSALPQSTAQRVANLKAGPSSAPASSRTPATTRATSQTISSLQRQSDASLRSRNPLPTIAGSPSVGTAGSNSTISKELKEYMPPPFVTNVSSSVSKETPTKIPRIHSRTSTVSSPALKASTSGPSTSRRASVIVSSLVASGSDPSPDSGAASMNEFGVMNNDDSNRTSAGTATQRQIARASPTPNGIRGPRASVATSGIPRKGNRESTSFGGLRKSSTGSVASISSVAPGEAVHHRFSALSPSKGLKLLSPKSSLPHSRNPNSASTHQSMPTPSSSRQSLSTPSPAPSLVDEEEMLGDEEMLHYIKRQQQKKLAHGATQEELDELLRFPEPLPPGRPSSPNMLLENGQRQHLSEYERKEILDYPDVYYIGAGSQKKPASPDRPNNNFGYDDDRGDYLVVNHDHLAYRYEIIDTLGKGSFGQVLNCRDHRTGESVAIKIIRNKKRFHHQALVEIKILDNLRKWDVEEKHHVIKMTEHFYFRNHLCIAMELLSINLYELIKANGFVGFTTALIRRFTSQMLLSLSLMRHHRIVHCDLKPENVLLRHPAKSAIKVIDFGSSCLEHEKIYTYIQSRFYRSPEVILGMNYHMAIDMWSLGCILAELYTGFPIFPGENEQEQLSCIMEVLGVPDKDFINRSSRKRLFFDSTGAPRPVVNSKGRRRRPGTKTLAQVLRCDDELFVDFIAKCLVWDPERRIKPQNAMRHPFITAGKRGKLTSPAHGTAKSLLSSASNLSTRNKPTETPKKSQISAPTPLTARMSRTNNALPTTPSNSISMHSLGSARSYRTSQSQATSSYHSSRTLNGFATTSSK
ncbi:hypothetical protein DENSPDRAFT_843097 [Dentipellis sp. KUC8613]|nr:hypothetical protein DENSPDRAFT_843097 [Dentipellis sp. KUC8613]